MSTHELLQRAAQLRSLAISAEPAVREDLLFLASEFDAVASRASDPSEVRPRSVTFPK
jgi:hypothetical protein